jgi:imidazolonepropionase-like amidohydrolase
MKSWPSILLIAAFAAAPALAQDPPIAFVGARIIPIDGPEIASGTLVVSGGRIVAVGDAASVRVPEGATRRDVAGKVLMPGLVDSHSHIGSPEGADSSAPLQADVRVLDSIDVRSPDVQKAQAGGITTANVMPGSGHLLSGQTLYLRLRDAGTIDALTQRDAAGRLRGGMKMANGTNPRRAAPFPGTRAKSAALVREQLVKAQEYREKIRAAGADATKLPARDLALEALVEVLDGKRVVHFHTHRHDDILTALRLAREFGFRVVLQHVSDGWKVADAIAAAKAPASIILIDSPGGKIETKDTHFRNGAVLEKAGVLVGFHTDDGITDSRLFLRSAGLAVRAGMSREKALRGLTLSNAEILEMADRVGSLTTGKDADFVLLSGDPLSVYTKVLETWVEGVRVFDRENPKDRLYAVGGYGAGREGHGLAERIEDEGLEMGY